MASFASAQGQEAFPHHVGRVFSEAIDTRHFTNADLELIELDCSDRYMREKSIIQSRVKGLPYCFSMVMTEFEPNEHIHLHGKKFALAEADLTLDFQPERNDLTIVSYSFSLDLGRIGMQAARLVRADQKVDSEINTLIASILGGARKALEPRQRQIAS